MRSQPVFCTISKQKQCDLLADASSIVSFACLHSGHMRSPLYLLLISIVLAARLCSAVSLTSLSRIFSQDKQLPHLTDAGYVDIQGNASIYAAYYECRDCSQLTEDTPVVLWLQVIHVMYVALHEIGWCILQNSCIMCSWAHGTRAAKLLRQGCVRSMKFRICRAVPAAPASLATSSSWDRTC